MTIVEQQSEVEAVKRASHRLRGDLDVELVDGSPRFSSASEQVLKFHGIYSQDDRDVRKERATRGEPLEYIFMVRVVAPGGRLSPEQWLVLDRISSEIADGTIRLTTRQAIQFHGVLKDGLRPTARFLDRELLSSFGACGDVVRNIVACPALQTGADGALAAIARSLSSAFRPASAANWELFVNGDRAASREEDEEKPFYGDTYLPRKFKIAVAHPLENCVDVLTQDIGLIPFEHPERGPGFNVLVGGGLGRSYSNADTFSRLADPFAFASYAETEGIVAAIVAAYRDLGNRTDRRRARLKYVIADQGIERFREEVAGHLGRPLLPPPPLPQLFDADDHLGWAVLADGSHQVGVHVGSGRVRDEVGGSRLKTALREIAESVPVTLLITPQQDLVISRIDPSDRARVASILEDHGVRSTDGLGVVERTALACPALPTCGQALTEAERRLPELVGVIERDLAARSIGRRPLQLRMTGCPNGCARPAVAEIGVVGRTKSTYDVFVGGSRRGDRLASLLAEKVPFDEIATVLGPLFDRWESESDPDEPFGDFVARVGFR